MPILHKLDHRLFDCCIILALFIMLYFYCRIVLLYFMLYASAWC